jgi:hypothetical protein
MSNPNKNWLVLILLMAVIFAAGLFFGKKQAVPEGPGSVIAQQEATGVPDQSIEAIEPEPEGDDGFKTAVSSDGKSSYRVRAGEGKSASRSDRERKPPRMFVDWEDEYESRDVLESAVGGDEDDAIAIGELVMQCRATYTSEQQLQSAMDRMSQNVAKGNPLPQILIPGSGETLKFTNFVEYENVTWERFAECQATAGMFDSALRDRLAAEARAGSATARFLYSMWLPKQHEINSQRLIEWITYQSNAWDFTWANIREGEPLGLLAYGRSLEQSGSIYFTPRHMNYGPAFILASQKCGLDNNTIEQKVTNMTSYWNDRRMTQRFNQATTLSDEIAKMFCQ